MAISSNFRIEDRITMNDKNITMVKMDTLCFGVQVEDQDGVPIDVAYAEFICKKTYDDISNIFKKTINNGITKVDDGVYSVKVSPSDTTDADPGEYHYAFRIGYGSVGAGVDTYTIFQGILEILPRVTG